MRFNMNVALENDLSINDVVVIALIDGISKKRGVGNKCVIGYDEIISEIPLIFNSSSQTNLKRLRAILNKESVERFVSRDIVQLGRGKGAEVTFTINKEMIDRLEFNDIISEE